jgi:DNA (cytosine-5)-methyltransferase 1
VGRGFFAEERGGFVKLHYNWTLKDANFTKDRGKVFSCFSCGGGSTMGYKLAGFDVIGCNEIDPRMMAVYKANHYPKFAFLEPIQTFKNCTDIPAELFDLDILDGSPPCSSFSMAGSREDDWGKEKKFREGQADQVLDTLFFDFIDLAARLQPKVVIAENVKGLLIGAAKDYVNRILLAFDKAGYFVRYDLLDASKMGIPQRRERVFFSAIRKDLYHGEFEDMFQTEPRVKLAFNERPILFDEIYQNGVDDRPAGRGKMFEYWQHREHGDESFAYTIKRMEPDSPERCFANKYLYSYIIPMTYTSNSDCIYLFDEYRKPNKFESCCIGSFPQDYNFTTQAYSYIIGMSVPPLMTARVADSVATQWLEINS